MSESNSEIVLELQDVETYYGKIHALRGISCSVRKGEIVTMLGANGAGKSTTLRTISGLNRASSGRITFMGEDITRKAPHEIVERGLIHVPEGRRIFKGMTIQENLELGSFTLKDDSERQKRMAHVFEIFLLACLGIIEPILPGFLCDIKFPTDLYFGIPSIFKLKIHI